MYIIDIHRSSMFPLNVAPFHEFRHRKLATVLESPRRRQSLPLPNEGPKRRVVSHFCGMSVPWHEGYMVWRLWRLRGTKWFQVEPSFRKIGDCGIHWQDLQSGAP